MQLIKKICPSFSTRKEPLNFPDNREKKNILLASFSQKYFDSTQENKKSCEVTNKKIIKASIVGLVIIIFSFFFFLYNPLASIISTVILVIFFTTLLVFSYKKNQLDNQRQTMKNCFLQQATLTSLTQILQEENNETTRQITDDNSLFLSNNFVIEEALFSEKIESYETTIEMKIQTFLEASRNHILATKSDTSNFIKKLQMKTDRLTECMSLPEKLDFFQTLTELSETIKSNIRSDQKTLLIYQREVKKISDLLEKNYCQLSHDNNLEIRNRILGLSDELLKRYQRVKKLYCFIAINEQKIQALSNTMLYLSTTMKYYLFNFYKNFNLVQSLYSKSKALQVAIPTVQSLRHSIKQLAEQTEITTHNLIKKIAIPCEESIELLSHIKQLALAIGTNILMEKNKILSFIPLEQTERDAFNSQYVEFDIGLTPFVVDSEYPFNYRSFSKDYLNNNSRLTIYCQVLKGFDRSLFNLTRHLNSKNLSLVTLFLKYKTMIPTLLIECNFIQSFFSASQSVIETQCKNYKKDLCFLKEVQMMMLNDKNTFSSEKLSRLQELSNTVYNETYQTYEQLQNFYDALLALLTEKLEHFKIFFALSKNSACALEMDAAYEQIRVMIENEIHKVLSELQQVNQSIEKSH